jgi:SOS-response transcriptional repressor LexA
MTIKEVRHRNLLALASRYGGSPGWQTRLAEACELAPGHVSQMANKTRNVGDKVARKIEAGTGLPEGWMDLPHDGEPPYAVKETAPTYGGNFEAGPDIRGRAPLISWVQAGSWSQIVDNFEPGDAEAWYPCPVPHGPHTYVLRVRGPSMTAPHGPSFPDGELIFVDPDKTPNNGSFVIVRLDDRDEATFKKLVIQGEDQYLEALNPAWPERIIKVNEHATFCGVVIFKGAPV